MPEPIIPPDALEGLMKKAFINGDMAPGLFWDALLKADLYVPLSREETRAEGEPALDPEMEEFPLLLGVDSRGRRVIWLFTSQEAMVEYTEQDLRFLKMNATTLFDRLGQTDKDIVLIGPGMLTLELHKQLVTSLGQGIVPESPEESVRYVPKNAEIRVGAPEDSEKLEVCLSDLFENVPEVLEAQFVQIVDDTGSRLLLGLRLEEESREHLRLVAEKVAKAAHGVLEKGRSIDVTLLGGSLKAAFEKWGKKFYEK